MQSFRMRSRVNRGTTFPSESLSALPSASTSYRPASSSFWYAADLRNAASTSETGMHTVPRVGTPFLSVWFTSTPAAAIRRRTMLPAWLGWSSPSMRVAERRYSSRTPFRESTSAETTRL